MKVGDKVKLNPEEEYIRCLLLDRQILPNEVFVLLPLRPEDSREYAFCLDIRIKTNSNEKQTIPFKLEELIPTSRFKKCEVVYAKPNP